MDYIVRYVDFPITVRGATIMDNNGFYNIYINARLSIDAQKKALAHEMEHIAREDFFSYGSLDEVESMWDLS